MNTQNWHDALDAQQDLLKFHSSKIGKEFTSLFLYSVAKQRGVVEADYDSIRFAFDEMSNNLAITIEEAECCFVSDDILEIAMQAAEDLPEEFILTAHDLITPCGFAYFETPLEGVDLHSEPFIINGVVWRYSEDTEGNEFVQLAWITDETDPRDAFGNLHLEQVRKEGGTVKYCVSHTDTVWLNKPLKWKKIKRTRDASGIEVEVPNEAFAFTRRCLQLFISLNLLAEQHISERVVSTPPRHVRKRARNTWHERKDFDISVITLRRKRATREKLDGEPTIEYTTRWIVGGHWRRQWYPSRNKHQWKYIHSYVKGPEGLPIKKSAKKVFNFVR